ncbi:protein GLUTAMINE DUMPER 2 [Brachypodium distachyon]|uniref:protein GLUTAMINE DUMPER 2 n=1 Tax=Brachypodium distachyon TaxID=15368 RepID=UPI0001C74267|nr:protein GLUTAMINE DUMPER 2 [Brachypodium distachyon]|eukprot:XP_003574564.1 protein GLUTAMINE DUMPER 2 [Brachypodium distachyon]
MRPGAGFNATAAAAVAPVAAAGAAHSAWHSPVPYLFGGLAAMLGLIAFALLILACSYWKLSGYLEGGAAGRGDGAGSAADGMKPAASDLPPPIWEEKILVIMAGDVKPTYLATPMSSRASSFGDRSSKGEEGGEEKKVQEVALASIKVDDNGEHSESQRETDDHHRIPEV